MSLAAKEIAMLHKQRYVNQTGMRRGDIRPKCAAVHADQSIQ